MASGVDRTSRALWHPCLRVRERHPAPGDIFTQRFRHDMVALGGRARRDSGSVMCSVEFVMDVLITKLLLATLPVMALVAIGDVILGGKELPPVAADTT